MSHYHLAHCIPHARMHGLHGYDEVIETVAWGLTQLGHRVTHDVNRFATSGTNIVFGAQVVPVPELSKLDRNTVVYNFEVLRGLKPDEIRPELRYCAEHFRIWDYCAANMESWSQLGHGDGRCVPVGYAPILTRIPKAADQDIDVLIYGLTGMNRLQAFHDLSKAGLATVFLSGMYGTARDSLISRSKIVLNVNLYKFARIFEIVRVSYLLANRKAVVADLHSDTFVEDDLRDVVRFSRPEHLVTECLALIDNEKERLGLEEAGLLAIQKRDITTILRDALR